MIDLESRAGRAAFIQEAESGFYTGTNVDGEDVMVFAEKGVAMEVCTRHAAKPLWWEVVGYSAEGDQESVSYNPAAELEEKLTKYDKRGKL